MQLFTNIYSTASSSVTPVQFLLTICVGLFMGVLLAAVYQYKAHYSKEFVLTLCIMPTIVALIIFLVNGSLGAGVAAAGTFSLIRFRSVAGSSKEMLAILSAMAVGLAVGMGYLGLAVLMNLVLSVVVLVFEKTRFAQTNQQSRHLLITVPLSFDYNHFFERGFGSSCQSVDLVSVSYKKKKEAMVLEYTIVLDKTKGDKEIMDWVLAARPLAIVMNKQIPKKKIL